MRRTWADRTNLPALILVATLTTGCGLSVRQTDGTSNTTAGGITYSQILFTVDDAANLYATGRNADGTLTLTDTVALEGNSTDIVVNRAGKCISVLIPGATKVKSFAYSNAGKLTLTDDDPTSGAGTDLSRHAASGSIYAASPAGIDHYSVADGCNLSLELTYAGNYTAIEAIGNKFLGALVGGGLDLFDIDGAGALSTRVNGALPSGTGVEIVGTAGATQSAFIATNGIDQIHGVDLASWPALVFTGNVALAATASDLTKSAKALMVMYSTGDANEIFFDDGNGNLSAAPAAVTSGSCAAIGEDTLTLSVFGEPGAPIQTGVWDENLGTHTADQNEGSLATNCLAAGISG